MTHKTLGEVCRQSMCEVEWRSAVAALIRDRLAEEAEVDEDVVRALEVGALNRAVASCTARDIPCSWENGVFFESYKAAALGVLRNAALVAKALRGGVDPRAVASMRPQELDRERWEALVCAKQRRDAMCAERPVATTDAFRCRKCGSRACTYYELQIRSSDESSTFFITCVDCGNRWREN